MTNPSARARSAEAGRVTLAGRAVLTSFATLPWGKPRRGVGPVEAAARVAAALARERPGAVLGVGLAGGRGLESGALVLGTEALYADIAAAIPVVSRVEPDAALLTTARAVLPGAHALTIATSAAVGGPRGWDPHHARVEAMEGFAVLRACELAGVPAVELRAISNELEPFQSPEVVPASQTTGVGRELFVAGDTGEFDAKVRAGTDRNR